jgi:2-oxo-hept-3-ene-1,7-dioate hydratase
LTSATVSETGQPIDLTGWQRPLLEVEVAIRVGVNGEIASLAPALELVDLDLPFDHIGPIIAANVFHRGVVFGPELTGLDPGATGLPVTVIRGGEVAASGALDEPPTVTLAMVRSFLDAHGAAIETGQRIIAGSLITPLAVSSGERLEIDFGPLGQMAISFS